MGIAVYGSLILNSGLRTPNSRGFTLIETIMTLVVLSIATVGVLAVFSAGSKGSADPLLITQATQLAQDRMETIIGDRRNPARGFAYIIPGNYGADVPMAGFNRSVSIFCVNAGDLTANNGAVLFPCATGYAHVTVTVANAVIGDVAVDSLVTDY